MNLHPFAFFRFVRKLDATGAIRSLDGVLIRGNRITVFEAKYKRSKGSSKN